MVAHASPAVSEPSPRLATIEADREAESSFDARWAAWIERGRQTDLVVQRNMRIALLGAAVIGLLVVVFFALAPGTR